MTALVSVETVLLVILVVLVAGLLRSHAEILRRLGPPGAEHDLAGAAGSSPAVAHRPPGVPAAPIAGCTPGGDAVALDLSAPGPATLLAFLSSGCSTCAGFWASLNDGHLPAGVQTVVVTHGSDRERPARIAELSAPGRPVIMSSQAWTDYAVPGSPYFVLVDGAIRGEGVATTWPALSSLVSDAIADGIPDPIPGGDRIAGAGPPSGGRDGTARALTVDRTLAGAGIGPEHPSLYPADPPPTTPRP